MLRVHRATNFSTDQVCISRVENSRKLIPKVESAIEHAWLDAINRPGIHLFDGPMCRLESLKIIDDQLSLALSRSNYKVFFGTNMNHPEFVDEFGSDVMANPVGVSPALKTSDGFLMLGQRNASMAYYPGRIHPFAGCMEPTDANIFTAVRRELAEELSFTPQDISDIRLTGIVEDTNLRQPELIFSVASTLTRQQIEARLDRVEHLGICAIPATAKNVESTIFQNDQLTPVAVAALLLWGRIHFGERWFQRISDECDSIAD
jgi:8-oxo-dGTP pyrophosphatase MutT (NUDIX family)